MTWIDAAAHLVAVAILCLIGEASRLAGFDFDRRLFFGLVMLGWMLGCLWHIGKWGWEDDQSCGS